MTSYFGWKMSHSPNSLESYIEKNDPEIGNLFVAINLEFVSGLSNLKSTFYYHSD